MFDSSAHDANKSDSGVHHIGVTPAFISSDLGSDQDIDATLDRGVAALRASGRLAYEDDSADRALVLAIVSAVFPV